MNPDRLFVRYQKTPEEPAESVKGEEAFRDAQYDDGTSAAFAWQTWLEAHIECFERTGDPVEALEAIRLCDSAGIYPPPSVQKWFTSALWKYAEAEGREDLENLLGLRTGEKGPQIPIRRYHQKVDRDNRMWVIHELIARFRVSIPEAVRMVWLRDYRNGNENLPSERWLEEDYRKRGKPQHKTLEKLPFSEGQNAAFLASFPRDSLPKRLR
jgi:hypothetical protein